MITFQCACGRRLKAKDESVGKRVRCPACGQVTTVAAPPAQAPAPADDLAPCRVVAEGAEAPAADGGELCLDAAADAADEELGGDGKRCPECHVALPQSSVLCTTCGYDFRTGKIFQPPKTLLEHIPWKKLGKVGWSLACLALVIALGYWAYGKIKAKGKEQEKALAASSTPASKDGEKGQGAPQHAAAIYVRISASPPTPALQKGFKFQYDDGEYSPRSARKVFYDSLRKEVEGRLLVVAGLKVLKSPKEEPPQGAERLTLRLTVRLGWAFQRVAGKLVPREPYIASCTAHLYRGGDVVIWKPKTVYAAPRPGEHNFSPEEVKAVATLKSAKASVDLQKTARSVAVAIIHTMFEAVPLPASLAGMLKQERALEKKAESIVAEIQEKGASPKASDLLKEGNQYVIAALAKKINETKDKELLGLIAKHTTNPDIEAQAKKALDKLTAVAARPKPGPNKKAPPTRPKKKGAASPLPDVVKNPDKALMKLAKTKFNGERGSFEAQLHLVRAAGHKTPYLALAFARTALELEEKEAVRRSYRGLCSMLEKREQPITEVESKALVSLLEAEPPGRLGRAALQALLASSYEGIEEQAGFYLAKVAAGRDTAEAQPEEGDGLAEFHLAILRGLAQRNGERGTEAAVALLMRAAKDQRNEIQVHVSLPPVQMGPKQRALMDVLVKGDPDALRNELLRAAPSRTLLRPLLDTLAIMVADNRDTSRLSAVLLYALAKNVQLKEPYLWRLADMLKNANAAERREAAERLRRLGEDAAAVLGELHAAHEAEKSASVRAVIAKAIVAAGGEVDTKPRGKPKKPRTSKRRTTTKKLRPKRKPGGKVYTPKVYQRRYD